MSFIHHCFRPLCPIATPVLPPLRAERRAVGRSGERLQLGRPGASFGPQEGRKGGRDRFSHHAQYLGRPGDFEKWRAEGLNVDSFFENRANDSYSYIH